MNAVPAWNQASRAYLRGLIPGLRPEEAVELRPENLASLPDHGWGELPGDETPQMRP